MSDMPVMTPASAPLSTAETPGELNLSFAHRGLTMQETDAARNCVISSPHTKLVVLPNHSMNLDGELEGFVFECCADDAASALPLTKASFGTTAT